MKNICMTIIIFIIFPVFSRGQADTVYFDNIGNYVSREYAVYYRTYIREARQKYRTTEFFVDDDRLRSVGYYTSKKKKGKKNGLFIFYDQFGQKQREGRYNNNAIVGTWSFYYPDSGQLWYTTENVNGKPVEIKSYYKSGRLKRIEHLNSDDTVATGTCYDETNRQIAFTPFIRIPKPKFSMNDFLAKNLKYPDEARKKNIEGRVIIKFKVFEDGTVWHPEVIKSVNPILDKEALRVVSKMPDWEPGMTDDKAVKVDFSLPIQFKLK